MKVFTCREFGFEWERELVSMALEKGHRAARAEKLLPHDVVINGLRVQCKRKNYQDPCGGIRIAKGQKRYTSGDFDVLALKFRERVFFIPSESIKRPGGTLSTKIRLEKFLRYEDNWGAFSGEGACDGADQKMLW